MRGFLFITVAALCAAQTVWGQDASGLSSSLQEVEKLDSVVVSASRAGKKTPVTYTMLGKEDLQSQSPLNSLPMSLSLQPSVVSSTEGGTGLGYSKLRIRGSKGSQINVTLNGVTLNDAESQEVFWVNIPALSSMLSSVQLQRGLGTTASGAGAFGASINMSTAMVGDKPSASFDYIRGAWNTSQTCLSLSSGKTASGLYANFLYSKGTTEGYIRNAFADVQSLMAVVGYLSEKNSLRFTYLMGKQHSGITWEGISQSALETDRRYNPAGEYYDQFGNVHYYDNESDNYLQQHFQLNYTHLFSAALSWTSTLNFTRGDGYYEQYKADKKLSKYGLEPVEFDGETYKRADFIIRKKKDNSLYVLNSDLRYHQGALKFDIGLSASAYDGGHFGNVIWCSLVPGEQDNWYYNSALKQDYSLFARGEYEFAQDWNFYLDLQYRLVSLRMQGQDDDFSDLGYEKSWAFFNPRAGVSYSPSEASKFYFSAALGHREPGRSDIKDVISSNNAGAEKAELKPESMLDLELGYEYHSTALSFSAALYAMEYQDMLLETGRLSSSGYALKENVGRAYRRGVELSAAYNPFSFLSLSAALNLSANRISDYTAYVSKYASYDDYTFVGQLEEHYQNTTMLMSPSAVASASVLLRPFVGCEKLSALEFRLNGRFVGKQYWDNTQCEDRSLPAYFVADASLSHSFKFAGGNLLRLGIYVDNLLNNKYCADAWVSREYYELEGEYVQYEGLFPQAPISCMLRVSYSF